MCTLFGMRDARLNEARDSKIPIRTNKAERYLIEEAAKRLNLTTSDYLRQVGIEHADSMGIKLPRTLPT